MRELLQPCRIYFHMIGNRFSVPLVPTFGPEPAAEGIQTSQRCGHNTTDCPKVGPEAIIALSYAASTQILSVGGSGRIPSAQRVRATSAWEACDVVVCKVLPGAGCGVRAARENSELAGSGCKLSELARAMAQACGEGRAWPHRSVLITASSYLPEPMPLSANMPWSAIQRNVSS